MSPPHAHTKLAWETWKTLTSCHLRVTSPTTGLGHSLKGSDFVCMWLISGYHFPCPLAMAHWPIKYLHRALLTWPSSHQKILSTLTAKTFFPLTKDVSPIVGLMIKFTPSTRERQIPFKKLFTFTAIIIHPLIKYVDSSIRLAEESTPSMRGMKTPLEILFTPKAKILFPLIKDVSSNVGLMIGSINLTIF